MARWLNDDYNFTTICSSCGSHPWHGSCPDAEQALNEWGYLYCPICGERMDDATGATGNNDSQEWPE